MSQQKWWDNYNIDSEYVSKPHELNEDEIIAFARQFDPQPFHLDPKAAKETIYGGLIASGWHLCSLSFRLFVDTGVFGDGQVSLGSPGVEDLKWKRPARPGDHLTLTARILDKFASKSEPEIGFLRVEFQLHNQNDELVITMTSNLMLRRKNEVNRPDGSN